MRLRDWASFSFSLPGYPSADPQSVQYLFSIEVEVQYQPELVVLQVGAFAGLVLVFVVGVDFDCLPIGKKHPR